MRTGAVSARWWHWQLKWRKLSVIIFAPLSLLFQVIIGLTDYCDTVADPGSCKTSYIIAMIILIIMHTLIDGALYLKIKQETEHRISQGEIELP
eukprot:CAMPEP_0176347518 /NCGR_PEP_ID=MMETSP0126-20121128/7122_1 /TAXON_ID=141414 ORGANISM="Strombidinopsis acuminatum, Strain SPMC142" /NCGR_SAMPLE_ID=MMETSP0126 /ASSEMBLY_ACC=CAM_ASM_000229 /LENGTH=93 /DNA_ID=CAMNT_0017695743 /DNA_START=258 /DNA_END=539 /DNA_ORIENTATION=-